MGFYIGVFKLLKAGGSGESHLAELQVSIRVGQLVKEKRAGRGGKPDCTQSSPTVVLFVIVNQLHRDRPENRSKVHCSCKQ